MKPQWGITAKGVYNWSLMFIKTVFKTTFGLSDVLKITLSALNEGGKGYFRDS